MSVAAPHCFEVMEQAPKRLSVPIIHDHQYGTATVIIAAPMNAFTLLGRNAAKQRVCGDGAARTATARLLKAFASAMCSLSGSAASNHTRKPRALVAERQAFVATRTPKY